MKVEHKGLKQFLQGTFAGGGDNLFVDANGVMRRIMDNDLNGDGIFDIVFPNSHAYIERAPTYIYTSNGQEWDQVELPHDSCWKPIVTDVDGDGYPDLIIVNGENGITSELQSYIYWGGPGGLTGERLAFDTVGAYDAAVCDLSGNGLPDLIFSTAWHDHHNPGMPLHQKIFRQVAPREFEDATEIYRVPGYATTSLVCEDLDGDGYPELVLANNRENYNPNTDSFIYKGTPEGFDTAHPLRLPTHHAIQVIAADLNQDGFKELVFTGGNGLIIYWNERGAFSSERCLRLQIQGVDTMFETGALAVDVADVDGDGIVELVIGTSEGVEIRKANDLNRIWVLLPCFGCTGVKAADIRNAGRMDIVASHYCSTKTYDTQSVVFWNGEHGFSTNRVSRFDTHGPMGCTAADLDQDGIMEVIFCNTMKGPSQYDPEFPVFVYYGTPDYKYTSDNRVDFPVKYGAYSYATADIDNDGYVELLSTTFEGIRIFKGTPTGPDPANYYDLLHSPNTNGRIIGGILVADLNRDGWLDIIMVPWVYDNSPEALENSVFVYWGGPEGYSNDRRTVLPSYVGLSQSVMLADLTNNGNLDFVYGDREGSLGIYYGDNQGGFSRGSIKLKDYNGAKIIGVTAADVDKDGWLEIFVTTAGHYSRLPSHLYVLRDGKNGYPQSGMSMYETGGTTGYPALADMRGSSNLDLLLPLYSTTETRELPARIFWNDGHGDFDWEHPQSIDCLSSIAFCPVDLTRNGYPDLFICCHRNDLGHIVNSKLILNGADGLELEQTQDILGYGPHSFTVRHQGNTYDRSDREFYTSPVFACEKPGKLVWTGECPFDTSLSFRVRFGRDEQTLLQSPWSDALQESGTALQAPADSRYMQYEVTFHAPGMVNSPRLTSVVIEQAQ